ncbi:thiopurine S-methyltransferase [Pseudoxanthomonas sp. GM95]|uniref:thiopurine S-methyltransferase n=1 Tax=Pseudoxanthomonas sp. GM95 TaxID=1881043 RepID=UPI0008B7E983|nr:thiopurine S-methyltransferase [Pseudoxanthomonas sp. GM95]SEL81036.1 thiopurine S-methyltransferase [Pseudoxanthomonas sp. GM95]
MHPEFWHERWDTNRIGFHQDKVMPLLQKHWPSLGLPAGSRVFVPLAGKSLDMAWLVAQGHRVLGVELSQVAVQAFFAEHGLTPQVRETRYGTHYAAGGIELICGDAFGLDADVLADCAGVYDRAALIALPEAMRQRYVAELYACLPAACRGLLITLEYPQAQKDGPPFSVEPDEVRSLFSPDWDIEDVERRDILSYEPRFAAEGVTRLETAVYRLGRR